MPRQLRMEYPGAIYHVMNRGDRREPIFKDDFDRERFVTRLGRSLRQDGLAGSRVSQAAGTTSALAAGGSAAGRTFYPARQRGRACELENDLEVRREAEDSDELKRIRRGWGLGGETFRQELCEQAHKRTGDSRVAKLKAEPDEQNEFNLE